MQQLSLRQLQMFLSVAQTLNLGTSAEQMFVTRGALSQGIKALESQLSVSLFSRVHGRLQLNSHGQQLLPLAQELLAREQQLLQQFNQGKPLSALRLGASGTIGNYLLPQLLARQWPDDWPYPKVTLANSQQLQQQLLDNQLDLALIETDRPHPQLEFVPWQQDQMIVIANASHPLANSAVSWSQLSQQPWVLREPYSGSRDQFDYQLAPRLKRINLRLELSSIEAVIGAVEAGLGISLLSTLACQRPLQHGRLSQLSLPMPLPRRLSLCFARSNQHSPQLQQLIRLLCQPQ
ncbi:LysR substrate-binding domain-containing protein [Ferrimonas senticii]|uniref:LysR substrate-binding domain-containing protein n=1 Tax=Ferrimonas senticii TaxID=394566 RepID=UPI00041107DB|nr:LysR substrate-binding domain-containing protein [Ferrimonas senticii]